MKNHSFDVRYAHYTCSAGASHAPRHHPRTQGRELNFDVVGHPQADYQFAVTFPFHPRKDGQKGGDVTVIREYAQVGRAAAGAD